MDVVQKPIYDGLQVSGNFEQSVARTVDSTYMFVEKGGLSKNCPTYQLVVKRLNKIISEEQLEVLEEIMEGKYKPGDKVPYKEVHDFYKDKEKDMFTELASSNLLPTGISVENLCPPKSNSKQNPKPSPKPNPEPNPEPNPDPTPKQNPKPSKTFDQKLVEIANNVARYQPAKRRNQKDDAANMKKACLHCHDMLLGRYLSNVGLEVTDKEKSIKEWEKHCTVIILEATLMAALDAKHMELTREPGIIVEGKKNRKYFFLNEEKNI